MNILQAIILSVVEGVTEFLPVSSTGHMILVSRLMGIGESEFTKSFEIIIQLGAILAVIVIYWKKIISNRSLWLQLLTAFLPTAILGLMFYSFIKSYLLGNALVVVISLFIGGIGLLFVRQKNSTSQQMTVSKAFRIGLFQSISMIPGVSRSAATILGGMAMGMTKKDAVEFSFLLAIPTMAAAAGLDLFKSSFSFSQNELMLLAVGFIGTFITALLAIRFFISYVQKHTFTAFGIYRIILSALYYILFIS